MMVVFVLNRAEYERFTGWEGPVGRDFQRRLRTLEFRARESAPIYRHDPRDPAPVLRVPGALKTSIKTVRAPAKPDQLEAWVGANPSPTGRKGYAEFQHEGTSAHVIRPRHAKALRFFWRRIGAVVVTTRVNHPGNPALKYISRWLPDAVR
jgi:hypothetical protein